MLNTLTEDIHMTIEPRVRSDNPDLHAAAYHEAGHAVAAVRQRLPLNSVDVTYVVGQRFGACDFDYEGATSDVRALCLLAAGAAERRYTGSHRAMDAGDVDRVGLLFKNSHLDPEIPYLQRQAGADMERQRVVNAWYAKAEQFVDREWEWIDRVARALTRRKQLTGDEVKTLCSHPVVHVDPPPPVDEAAVPTPTVAPDHALVTKTTGNRTPPAPAAMPIVSSTNFATKDFLDRYGMKYVTYKGLSTACDVLVAVLHEQRSRADALEARLAALESEQLKFQGPHSEAKSYRRNDIVQRGGGAWICTTAFAQGAFQHEHWRLLIKKGSA